jgi:predicted secreted hydrolase
MNSAGSRLLVAKGWMRQMLLVLGVTCSGLLVGTIALAESQQPYQLLQGDPAGYGAVVPGRSIELPADHLPHKDYRIEWWYLTANLQDAEGNDYGVHWTLFRQSLSAAADPGGWASNQVYMAHGALTTPDGHVYEQRFARGGIGQAGVALDEQGHFAAWLDDWQLQGEADGPLPGRLVFTVAGAKIELDLQANTPWVLQGQNGYSQKSAQGQASYYYSQPHIRISGSLQQHGEAVALEGVGWLDREWSSQPLAPDQPGWDWLALHLDDGSALMVYRLRQADRDHWISGSWVDLQGHATTLAPADVVFEPLATNAVTSATGRVRDLPLSWRVALPAKGLSWTVSPVAVDHWLDTAFPYWEGPVRVQGSTTGRGYLELTGYE